MSLDIPSVDREDLEDLPVVGFVFRVGARDRFLDFLVLLGPVLIAIVAVVGRSPVTTGLAATYVLALPGYVLLKGVRRRD